MVYKAHAEDRQPHEDKKASGFFRYFCITSTLVFILLLIFVFVDGFLSMSSSARRDTPLSKYNDDLLLQAYPGKNIEKIHDILRDSWRLEFDYDEAGQFRLREKHSTYYNMDKYGFRWVNNQCSFPLKEEDVTIFVFGGSTVQGAGLPDDETIPSYLQEHLRDRWQGTVCVYNFGRAYYTRRQEAALFINLLRKSFVPDYAVFIDGLNDYYYTLQDLAFTDEIEALFNNSIHLWYPRAVTLTFREQKERENISLGAIVKKISDSSTQYFFDAKTIHAVAELYDTKTLFVVQPTPTYAYNLSNDLFGKDITKFGDHIYSLAGYAVMDLLKADDVPYNLLWLDKIQQNKTKNLYIDMMHYTAAFSDEIAGQVAEALDTVLKGGVVAHRETHDKSTSYNLQNMNGYVLATFSRDNGVSTIHIENFQPTETSPESL